MDFENKALDTRFSVPDRPTVRQQLRFKGEIVNRAREEIFERLWQAAKGLIETWESPHLQLGDSIDEISDPSAVKVIVWAGGEVLEFVNSLDDLPKNS